MRILQQYVLYKNGKYERVEYKHHVILTPLKKGWKIDSCSKFIPYWLHLWLEEHWFFPIADKLREQLGAEKGWITLSWKLTDFIYGLVNGFPICCCFYYSLRENWGDQIGWDDNYVICRRCIKKKKEGKK